MTKEEVQSIISKWKMELKNDVPQEEVFGFEDEDSDLEKKKVEAADKATAVAKGKKPGSKSTKKMMTTKKQTTEVIEDP